MENKKALEILKLHNNWRRDSSVPPLTEMVNCTELGDALDVAIKVMEERDTISLERNQMTKNQKVDQYLREIGDTQKWRSEYLYMHSKSAAFKMWEFGHAWRDLIKSIKNIFK
tara:strand:+ start:236 stop:574 length:339 start_codon:yes stop_codon:yes gene_type:complete